MCPVQTQSTLSLSPYPRGTENYPNHVSLCCVHWTMEWQRAESSLQVSQDWFHIFKHMNKTENEYTTVTVCVVHRA